MATSATAAVQLSPRRPPPWTNYVEQKESSSLVFVLAFVWGTQSSATPHYRHLHTHLSRLSPAMTPIVDRPVPSSCCCDPLDRSGQGPLHLHLHLGDRRRPCRTRSMTAMNAVTAMTAAAAALAAPLCTAYTPAAVAGRTGARAILEIRRREAVPQPYSSGDSDLITSLFDDGVDVSAAVALERGRRQRSIEARLPSSAEDLFGEGEDDSAAASSAAVRSRVRAELPAVSDLRAATGSEVPDAELALQLEAARRRSARGDAAAAAAAQSEREGATPLEAMAMGAVPSQLPGPAVRTVAVKARAAMLNQTKKRNKKTEAVVAATAAAAPKRPRARIASKTKAISSKVAKSKKSLLLSAEEEVELARTIQRGVDLHKTKADVEAFRGRAITREEWAKAASLPSTRDLRRHISDYRTAKSDLVTANLGLVYSVARSKHGNRLRNAGISEDELVQEASIGLIRAAELFDPERGLRFSTYATIWIKGVLSNSSVDEAISLPAREKTKWNKIYKASRDLVLADGNSDQVGRAAKPKLKDVARLTGMKEEEVESVADKMEKTRNVLSLDYRYVTTSRSGADARSTDRGLDRDRSLQDDADLADRIQIRADVIAALARNLTPAEARLMRLRYGLNDGISRSLAECAEAMGCSRDRARYLANGCLKKLREADEAGSLQEYLLTVA